MLQQKSAWYSEMQQQHNRQDLISFLMFSMQDLNVTFTLPDKSSFVVELNKQIPVKASATLADSVTLYINNKFIKCGTKH